jgi:carboxypeptidase Q
MRLILTASLALFTLAAPAQNPVSPETRTAVRNLIGEVLLNGQAYEYDRQLADTYKTLKSLNWVP